MGPGITSSLCSENMSNHQIIRHPETQLTCVAPTERAISVLFCHLFHTVTCLKPVIVLWNARPDLANVRNLRSGGAVVRDNKAIKIKIPRPNHRFTCHLGAPESQSVAWRTAMDLCSRPTQPGMHKALLVDEIVRRIAEHLFDSKDKSSSLAFSLCCRSLNDPVLDVLWDWQTDLFTLFKVLPPDLWEVNNTAGLVSVDQRIPPDRFEHSPVCGPTS